MHRNLNASFEDTSYSKRSHKNPHGSRNKADKENLRRSFEAGAPLSKIALPQSHTFAANSPSYASNKEEVVTVANILNYPPKKPTELRDNSQNRLNYENDNEQNFYTNSEIISLRKALNEAQIKSTAMSKDLSKFQHENSMLHLQIRRNEIRISELTESRAADQMKIADLASQKSQLNNEMNKLRLESHDSSHKTKGDVENLRKNFADVEAIMQSKHKKMSRCAKHMRHAIHALQNLLFDLEVTKNPQCQNILDKIQEILDRILNIASSSPTQNHGEENNSNDGEEYEMSRSMKGMMEKFQLENNELKDHIAFIENLLQKERFKTKTLLPQYRETVDKLKRSAYGMKERLQESQNIRKEERTKLTNDLQEVKKINKEFHDEIKSLKVMNSELTGRTKHYESLVTKNEEKVQKLIQDHQRLEKLVRIMKKNEEANKISSNDQESDSRHYKKRAYSREPQKSSSNKIAIETDTEDTSAARSSLPRSSSASRGSRQQIHARDHHSLRSREGNFEFTFEHSNNKLSQTQALITMESRKNKSNPMNKSVDVDRLRSAKLAKSFWVEDPSAVAPNNDNAELMARCFTLQKSRCDDGEPSVNEQQQKSQGGPRGFFGSQLEGYQEAESTQRESEQETSFNDIKDEIADLENEIGEIDNYMKDQMNTANSTYIDN